MSKDKQNLEIEHEPIGSELACILGLNIERLRKRSKINKTIFSLMLGIGRPTLNKLERGTGNPRLDLIERIASALEVDVQELLRAPFTDVDSTFYIKSRQNLYVEDTEAAAAAAAYES